MKNIVFKLLIVLSMVMICNRFNINLHAENNKGIYMLNSIYIPFVILKKIQLASLHRIYIQFLQL
ncbi:hypothetical protein CN281_29460 [Bacillus cereus]|nr:hypothetical protein CN281_29460 [Bacillus cereus]